MPRRPAPIRDPFYIPEFYDEFNRCPTGDDVTFYREMAVRTGGPVLELGSGTGRVAIPLARDGFEVVGLDKSRAMIERARSKSAEEPPEIRSRLSWREGSMDDFRFDQKFPLVLVPFRAFLHNPDTAHQRATLACIRRHLPPRGRAVIAMFDPHLGLLATTPQEEILGHPVRFTGEFDEPGTPNRIQLHTARRVINHTDQRMEEEWIYKRLDPDGRVLDEVHKRLTLRYIFRYEMQNLVEGAGFAVEHLYGGFRGEPFKAGCEQVWVLSKDESARRE